MSAARGALAWSGLAGSAAGFGTVFLAIALSPSFSFATSALSDLGTPAAATPWLFNGGLVTAGVIGLPFGWVLLEAARNAVERIGAVLYTLTVVLLALIGVFPSGTDLHVPVAIGYFVGISFTAWVHGSGAVLAGDQRRGLAAVWLGIGNGLGWLLWAATGLGGLAVPELVGSVALLAWLAQTTRWLRRPAGR